MTHDATSHFDRIPAVIVAVGGALVVVAVTDPDLRLAVALVLDAVIDAHGGGDSVDLFLGVVVVIVAET